VAIEFTCNRENGLKICPEETGPFEIIRLSPCIRMQAAKAGVPSLQIIFSYILEGVHA
jgi:hypothetical protein